MSLFAPEVSIEGGVWARGERGGCPDNTSVFSGGGGGGGSGGLVRITTDVLTGTGMLSVRGGGSCGDVDMGGGGGGGWVIIEGVPSIGGLQVRLGGGLGAFPGGAGRLFIDEDADKELQISYLEEQLLTSENEAHKRYLRDRLEELGVADNYERTLSLQRSFNAEREERFPYLREHEYALLRDEAARAPEPAG